MLKVSSLTKEYKTGDHTLKATNNISFSVENGEFISLVGQSGSGKSTLLVLLGGLDTPTSGSIEVDGEDLAQKSEHELVKYRCLKLGYVFQSFYLVPNLTALENVMLPMEFAGVLPSERRERAQSLLNQVGISGDKLSRRPGKLSGGEQQRVAIARALANKPKLILADEPTGNLDSTTGKKIFDLLKNISKTEKTTIIIATHDQKIANQADRKLTIVDGHLKQPK